MISLTGTLTTAQKLGNKPLFKVLLERTGFTTYTYTLSRIIDIRHSETDWNRSIEVVLDNSDSALTSLNFLGYTATVGFGYTIASGADEYVGWVTKVIAQRLDTYQGGLRFILSCAGLGNQIAEDKASVDYFPAVSDTTTVKGFINSIAGSSLACFSHTTPFTVDWDIEDWLIDSFAPADSFKIYFGQSKRDKIKELLSYTACDSKIDSDNHLSVFMTFARAWQATYSYSLNVIVKPTLPSNWAANTAYSLNNRVKPTTANGFWYVCTTAGTSHATTEPVWVTQDGLTITDGTVTWACRDTNYIYTCTTLGVSGGTEPVWTYTADATVADNTVVWTLKYDYLYATGASNHQFWQKGSRQRIVVPNKITVKTHPSYTTSYSASTTEPVSYALLPKDDFLYLRLASSAQAGSIAAARIDRYARDAESGDGLLMMNVGQEVQDYIQITDTWGNDTIRGRIRSINRHASHQKFEMQVSFSSRIAQFPVGTYANLIGDAEPGEPLPEWAQQLQENVYKNDNLLLDEINNMRQEVERIVMEGQFNRPVYIKVVAEDTALTTGDGKAYFTVPPELHGRNLVDVYASVYTASTSGNPTIQIARIRSAATVDVLSTKLTIDANETSSLTAATAVVIDTSNDDLQQGDFLRVDCDSSGSGAKGLDVVAVASLPRS